MDAALKAVELDYSADTLSQLGWVYARFFKQFDKGIENAERGLALNPNNSRALTNLGLTLWASGRCEDSLHLFDKALRISPIPSANILMSAASGHKECQRYDDCITLTQKAIELSPDSIISHIILTSCYGQSGRIDEAKNQAKEVLRINPNFKVRENSLFPTNNEKAQEAAARHRNALIMAGLPPDKSLKNAGE